MEANAGEEVTLKVVAHDQEGDVLTYTWEVSGGKLSSRNQETVVWMNEGELKDDVEDRLLTLGVDSSTIRPGYLSDARELLTAADVYVHLARWEGAPYSVMESMTAGVPVVAARAVGTADLIEDGVTGILVDQGDVGEAASAVVRLLTDVGEARTLSQNARKAITVHHDRAAMARATEKVYRELVPS